ncbi:hypothetical protein GCM10011581_38110 [Saccharopolyspora subtropica]|uniref:NodB homology domain-containing protein n=1 Tax=Saccharopolyspora thermophila TaxID=89367 RepID=A0A917K1E7_9PSEU|nr:polysaccharide deacetylase family protein [Saccharopolyspora subtropica]GGI97275.1 hypothetical protein GCM10011581_38110 [Saccharopolyspora subtropica]
MDGVRPTRASTLLALAAAGLLAVLLMAPAGHARPAAPRTVVTFTVDDGSVSQTVGARILSKYRMRGTFYVSSGAIGTPGYLSMDDLRAIAAAGHEIGGHTVNHPDLATVSIQEARREICQDRANLTALGLRPTSFAYPFGSFTPAAQQAVRDCGYNSARVTGSIRTAHGCANCAPAESIPPADPMLVRGTDMVTPSWTLEELQRVVLDAEASGGGWVPLVLHQICDFCGPLAVNPVVLDEFAFWLSARASRGTVVRTVDEVVGGGARPLVAAPPPEAREGLVNASLEEPGPRGWVTSSWGRNTPRWTRTEDAHTGRWAQRLDMTAYTDGDAKLMSRFDLGEVAPTARPDNTYTLGAWYKSTAPVQLAVHRRDRAGIWRYWTTSPWFAPAGEWTNATWTTPPAPPDTTGLSFGLALAAPGSLTTDDYHLRENPAWHRTGICERVPWGLLIRWFC